MNKLIPTLTYILILFLFACKPASDEGLALYEVTKRDFIDAAAVDGYTEPTMAVGISCPSRISGTIAWIIEDGTIVKEGDIVVRLESEDLSSQYDNQLTSLENQEAEVIKMRANQELQLALLDAQIKTNEAETQITALDSLQLQFTENNQRRIKALELERSAIQNARFQSKIKTTRLIQNTELRRRELIVNRARIRVQEAKDRLGDLIIRAPQDGMVIIRRNGNTWKNFTLGDNVYSNLQIASIPNLTKMQVIIRAPEDAYKRINIGDSTLFLFDAMPNNRAVGKIEKKSPVGQAIANNSRVKFFEITASVDTYNEIPGAGLSVNALVIQQHIPDTIAIPNISVFDKDSMKVVYVAQKKGFEMREVNTSNTSTKDVVITKGLQAGEVISLLQPNENQIKKETKLNKTTNPKQSTK